MEGYQTEKNIVKDLYTVKERNETKKFYEKMRITKREKTELSKKWKIRSNKGKMYRTFTFRKFITLAYITANKRKRIQEG